jgi:hypothetical protein
VGSGEDVQLLLHDRDARGRVLGDLARDLQRERFQVGRGDHIVDDAMALCPVSVYGLGREDHLLGDPQARGTSWRNGSAQPSGSRRDSGVLELAALYGGGLTLSNAPIGGLRAELVLPAA